MERKNIIQSGGFFFIHNFDSGNLGQVERVPTELISPGVNHRTNSPETPEYEFNLWTRPDCAGTEFENGNRTWFYFGVQASEPGILVRLNLINLNKQGKMYNQGMAPVTRTLPGKPQWERIKDRPMHSTDDNTFTLSFKYRTSENPKATTFFAFTYPYSFAELQIALNSIDLKMLPLPPFSSPDDIYYCRECLVYSLEGRRVDLLTITSHHGITKEREERLKNLFPDNQERPLKFQNKKIIFVSARVHPGETPSSFVFNGFLNLLLNRNDPTALQLRKLYVFKLIPFLNPDGVARGHYRTDTRGVNLNRVYLNPSLALHPTVYASRALIRYYHYGCEKEDSFEESKSFMSRSLQNIDETEIDMKTKKLIRDPSQIKSSRKVNKSSSNIKSATSKKITRGISADETDLTEQVLDMKIHEQPSDTEGSAKPTKKPSLLSDDMLRTYLGSDVHLNSNEEMNIQGGNPLGSLRDTLQNSISLLMESSSANPGDNSATTTKESKLSNLKMGWCRECRLSADKLEHSIPGITAQVPGYSQTHDVEAATAEVGDRFFCTNCFKRYLISESRQEVKIPDNPVISESVSAGDGSLVKETSLEEPDVSSSGGDTTISMSPSKEEKPKPITKCPPQPPPIIRKKPQAPAPSTNKLAIKEMLKEPDSGLFLYIDLHGHASKKGIFMYGNHFEDVESSVECMLLPRIMSLNNLHFHFSSCNFTERNMYLKDRRDGMSREGSGRVAVLKATGLVRSYTLECNYNTGRLVNILPPTAKDGPAATPLASCSPMPPKYTPHIYEEIRQKKIRARYLEVFEEKEIDPMQVGASLGASILDLTGAHPNSRIPCSEHRSIPAVRDWLRTHCRSMRPAVTTIRLRPKTSSPTRVPLYARAKGKVIDERKENTYAGAKTDTEHKRSPPVFAQRSGHDIINLNVKITKKTEPVKSSSRTRYLAENEPKPKSLTSKRRNILAIRKPNTSKTQAGGIVKAKVSRRSMDDSETPRSSIATSKLCKRSYSRTIRGAVPRTESSRRPIPSSSSDDIGNGTWEDVAGGTVLGSQSNVESLAMAGKRRPFPGPSPARLKKIRLKTAL